jgi:hypothetical protein
VINWLPNKRGEDVRGRDWKEGWVPRQKNKGREGGEREGKEGKKGTGE